MNEKDELIQRLRSLAQSWRDRAYLCRGHALFKAESLEECAEELDAELTRRVG